MVAIGLEVAHVVEGVDRARHRAERGHRQRLAQDPVGVAQVLGEDQRRGDKQVLDPLPGAQGQERGPDLTASHLPIAGAGIARTATTTAAAIIAAVVVAPVVVAARGVLLVLEVGVDHLVLAVAADLAAGLGATRGHRLEHALAVGAIEVGAQLGAVGELQQLAAGGGDLLDRLGVLVGRRDLADQLADPPAPVLGRHHRQCVDVGHQAQRHHHAQEERH